MFSVYVYEGAQIAEQHAFAHWAWGTLIGRNRAAAVSTKPPRYFQRSTTRFSTYKIIGNAIGVLASHGPMRPHQVEASSTAHSMRYTPIRDYVH